MAYQAPEPRQLDPNQETTIFTHQHVGNAYNNLVRIDPLKLPDERVIIPDLATEWTVAPDGTSITFRLREGVRFHDGEPFTSEDVKATVERIRDAPAGIRSPLGRFFKGATVETPDPLTVVVKFPQPVPFVLQIFASPTLAIVPAHRVERDQKALENTAVGTGALKFDRWERGVQVVLVRNEDYWDKPLPYLDGIRWLIIPEPATQVAAFIAGRVNFTGQGFRGLSKTDVDRVKREVAGAKISAYFSTTQLLIFMNTRVPPFNDPRVRRAVFLTIDQKEMVDVAWEGAAAFTDFIGALPLPWSLPLEDLKDFPPYRGVTEEDREEARRLLAQAGYPDGLEVDYPLYGLIERAAVVNMEQLRRVGIRATARIREYGPEWVPETRAGKFRITTGHIPYAFYDPALALSAFTAGHPENRMGYNNPRVEELHARLSSTLDAAARRRLAREIQMILFEDLPAIPGAIPTFFHGARPEVRGWTHPGILRDNLRYDYVWLAQ